MPKYFWLDTLLANDVSSAAQGLFTLMTGPTAIQTRGDQLTLMRTIVRIDLAPVVHDQGEGSALIDLGIAIASQEAFTGGVVPDPSTPTDFPIRGWVWRTRHRVFGFQAGVADVDAVRINEDIRARRKLDNGEAYLVVDNTDLEGVAVPVTIAALVRQLWMVS